MQDHAEAAEHAHEGNKRAALLVAIMAAALALSEQGAKHAEMRIAESSIAAVDTWAQYQAKSTRAAMTRDFADLLAELPPAPNAAGRASLAARLQGDIGRFESGPDGKAAIAARASELEHERGRAAQRAHAFDTAAALLELGIVLATASVIVRAASLLWLAGGLGASGVVCALLALLAPAAVVF